VQQLCKTCKTCFMVYCMFYFSCDRSLKQNHCCITWWTPVHCASCILLPLPNEQRCSLFRTPQLDDATHSTSNSIFGGWVPPSSRSLTARFTRLHRQSFVQPDSRLLGTFVLVAIWTACKWTEYCLSATNIRVLSLLFSSFGRPRTPTRALSLSHLSGEDLK